jgi:hypothetical protein
VIGLALMLSFGCSSSSGEKTASSDSASSTQAPKNEDQQIRELYQQGNAAVEDFDVEKMIDLTCAKYVPQIQTNVDKTIPPMSSFGTPGQLSALGVDKISSLLGQSFKPASDEAIAKVAQALVYNDEPGYHAAMIVVLREGTTKKLDKIENISVKGDTATADTTTTEKVFGEPAKTETDSSQAVRENGKWKDCTPPKGG